MRRCDYCWRNFRGSGRYCSREHANAARNQRRRLANVKPPDASPFLKLFLRRMAERGL